MHSLLAMGDPVERDGFRSSHLAEPPTPGRLPADVAGAHFRHSVVCHAAVEALVGKHGFLAFVSPLPGSLDIGRNPH